MKKNKKKTTMKDVGAEAGVSVATVSAVLNEQTGNIPISDKTRQAVQLAVKKLNYRMNEQARSLRTGKSHTVGIVASDITQPFSGEMIRQIEQQVYKWGYNFLLSEIRDNKEHKEFCLNLFVQKKVDGILFIGASNEIDDSGILELVENGIPVVLTERDVAGSQVPSVRVDNSEGAFLATKHLIAKGRKMIGYLNGPSENIISSERQQGYKKALIQAGMASGDDLVVEAGIGLADGYRAMSELLKKADQLDAVFAFNDMVAIGAMKAIRDNDLKIGDDIAIVGFDDIPVAEFCEPGLTTVRQPVVEMCVKGVDLLLGMLDNGSSKGQRIVLEPELIVRKSCGSTESSSFVGETDEKGSNY